MKEQEEKKVVDFTDDYPKFTPEMKATHTILIPDMLPWHFDLLVHVMRLHGYKVEVLKNEGRAVIDEGLKHVHNDACYPALCVIGQYLDALKSGKYDPDHTAVMITQSGGGCRASNYIPLIRKAMKAEFPKVPVLSLNFAGLEKGNGLEITLGFLIELGYAIFYGDLIMSAFNQTKPYETEEGAAAKAREECVKYIRSAYDDRSFGRFTRNVKYILDAFMRVPVKLVPKVKVGIVGEIYVKYSPLGNSHLEDFLLSEGCEPVVPALMDFILYCVINTVNDAKFYGQKRLMAVAFRNLNIRAGKHLAVGKVIQIRHEFRIRPEKSGVRRIIRPDTESLHLFSGFFRQHSILLAGTSCRKKPASRKKQE